MQVSEILRVKGSTLFTVGPETKLSDAVITMADNDIGSVIVMDKGALLGLVTFREVMRVIAARQAGAGFGGCLIALVKEGSVDDFSLFVQEDYFKRAGIQARIYPVTASPGAGVIAWDGSG